ncbi:MAG: hypothetical protein AB1696_21840 [Planctomycetota bacterium]
MWETLAKVACYTSGIIAPAAAVLYGLWALCILRGKALVIRSDHLLCFRLVCLFPFLVVAPVLFGYRPHSPLGWGVLVLLAYHFAGVVQHALTSFFVECYNVSKADALLAVRRAFVLAQSDFRERESRFISKGRSEAPLAAVEFDTRKPQGIVRLLPGGTRSLYRLIAASCGLSSATRGASARFFILHSVEMLCVGGLAWWLFLGGMG